MKYIPCLLFFFFFFLLRGLNSFRHSPYSHCRCLFLAGTKTATSYFQVLSVVWSIIQQYLFIIFCCPFLYQFLNSHRCFLSTEVLFVDSFQEKPSQFYILQFVQLYILLVSEFNNRQCFFWCFFFYKPLLFFHSAVITVHVCINGQCSLFMSSMCVFSQQVCPNKKQQCGLKWEKKEQSNTTQISLKNWWTKNSAMHSLLAAKQSTDPLATTQSTDPSGYKSGNQKK